MRTALAPTTVTFANRQKSARHTRASRIVMASFYDLKAPDVNGKEVDFATFKGKVVLVTNVASKCGYTKANYQVRGRKKKTTSCANASEFAKRVVSVARRREGVWAKGAGGRRERARLNEARARVDIDVGDGDVVRKVRRQGIGNRVLSVRSIRWARTPARRDLLVR